MPYNIKVDRPTETVMRYSRGDLTKMNKMACFDLDWTLGRPPKRVVSNEIVILPLRHKSLEWFVEQGFLPVIFTNQYAKNVGEVNNKHLKIMSFLSQLDNVPIVVLMSLAHDQYRKPSTGMWSLLPFSPQESFYCGDAAGRPEDFADSDLQFASGLGIKFFTPEEVFPSFSNPIKKEKHMIVMMGMQGSGKSSFYHSRLLGLKYHHVSQDIQGTEAKTIKMVRDILPSGQCICVDNTNPSVKKREKFLSIAHTSGYTTSILYIVRNGEGNNKLRVKPIPGIGYSMYYKNLELPQPEETTDGAYEIMEF
jgi:bifunctional polynucleotide phosphatase/kinase